MRRLIFVGPQGSGKGTQAEVISSKLKIAHISTGDLLRHAKGKLKKEIDEAINAGNLVSDELILKILKKIFIGRSSGNRTDKVHVDII